MTKLTGSVSLDDHVYPVLDELIKTIQGVALKTAAQAIEVALNDDDTFVYFPAIWGDSDGADGPAPVDPLEIRFVFEGLCSGAGANPPTWKTSLSDILANDIADAAQDGSFADGLCRIRDGLRALADRIELAITPIPVARRSSRHVSRKRRTS